MTSTTPSSSLPNGLYTICLDVGWSVFDFLSGDSLAATKVEAAGECGRLRADDVDAIGLNRSTSFALPLGVDNDSERLLATVVDGFLLETGFDVSDSASFVVWLSDVKKSLNFSDVRSVVLD